MEPRNRFAVQAEELDGVRVRPEQQVEAQVEPRAPESSSWNGQVPHAYGDGATQADADGE